MFRLVRRIGLPFAVVSLTAIGLALGGGSSVVGSETTRASHMSPVQPSVFSSGSATTDEFVLAVSSRHSVLQLPSKPVSPAAAQTQATEVDSTLRLGFADNGSTRTVAVGTPIVVQLPGVPRFRWTVPDSSDNEVVRRTAGAVGGEGSAQAAFVAAKPGVAVLSAVDNPLCFPVCAIPPAGGWRVTIIVK